jgi:hypothetical protein
MSGIRESQVDIPPRERQQLTWETTKFYRSWVVYDSDMAPKNTGINWNMVLGLVLALAVSIGCWAGAGILIARLLK